MPGARLELLSGEVAMAAAGEAHFLVVGAEGDDEPSLALARRLCRESRSANHLSVLVVSGDTRGHAPAMPSSPPALLSLVREVSRDLFAEHAAPGCPGRDAPKLSA